MWHKHLLIFTFSSKIQICNEGLSFTHYCHDKHCFINSVIFSSTLHYFQIFKLFYNVKYFLNINFIQTAKRSKDSFLDTLFVSLMPLIHPIHNLLCLFCRGKTMDHFNCICLGWGKFRGMKAVLIQNNYTVCCTERHCTSIFYIAL